MKLGKLGTIGGLRTFEEREDDERRERLRQVREERLRIARASHYWTEIHDDLVERDRGTSTFRRRVISSTRASQGWCSSPTR